jgi:hypothetical protein
LESYLPLMPPAKTIQIIYISNDMTIILLLDPNG